MNQFVIVFIDDILTYFKSEEEHKKHFTNFTSKLREKQLYVKFSNCEFWLNEVGFFGHIISKEGITVDPSKIVVIKEWPTHQCY